MTKSKLPPLPETDYYIGVMGDGYSEDRVIAWPAWDDDAVAQIQKEAWNKALDLAIDLVDNAVTPDGWTTSQISYNIECLKERL